MKRTPNCSALFGILAAAKITCRIMRKCIASACGYSQSSLHMQESSFPTFFSFWPPIFQYYREYVVTIKRHAEAMCKLNARSNFFGIYFIVQAKGTWTHFNCWGGFNYVRFKPHPDVCRPAIRFQKRCLAEHSFLCSPLNKVIKSVMKWFQPFAKICSFSEQNEPLRNVQRTLFCPKRS